MVRRDYTVRELMAMSKDEVWGLPVGGLNLTFDNGETKKFKTRSTITSWYYWKLANEFPGLMLEPIHHVGDGQYTTDSHVDFMSMFFWDVFGSNIACSLPGAGQDAVWRMSRRVYQITNEMYNDFAIRLGEYVTGMDLQDLLDVLLHPKIKDAKARFANDELTVNEAHELVMDVVEHAPELRHNPVSMGVRVGLLNRRQITQMIGPRGYILDINGEACKTPIYKGYGDGLSELYDRLIESRTASLSLYMASGPLEQSEYFNRQAQFLCGVIRGVEYSDCGGQHTVPWQVRPQDVKALIGKYHMVDGQPVLIGRMGSKRKLGIEEAKQLIGKTIQLRSICTCSNSDPTMPCMTCVGWNARITPPHANLGHYLSTEPLARLSQTILSTKHVIASAKRSYLVITAAMEDLFRYGEERQFIHLQNRVCSRGWTVRFPMIEAQFINDIMECDIEEISPARVTDIQTAEFVYFDSEGIAKSSFPADVRVGGRGSPLSREFLQYMKDHGWSNQGPMIQVDLENWTTEAPFIVTPPRGENIMEILEIVKDFVHCPDSGQRIRVKDFTEPGPALMALLDGMSTKLSVNLSHVEVFVRALMCRINSDGTQSYQMPVAGQPFRFRPLKEVVLNRGLGAALAYEGTGKLIMSPETYLRYGTDIPEHPLDAVWATD